MLEIIKYILLGIVQGISEILPISSSGHLVIFQEIFKIVEPGLLFEMFTNIASFLALFILFYKDIFKLVKDFFLYIFKKEKEEYKEGFFYALKLVVVVIPIGIFGLIFKDKIGEIKNLLTIGLSLIVTGGLLLTIYYTRNLIKDKEDITFKDALIIGLIQVLAIFPGISRSGSTIIGGRVQKIKLQEILKFSFLAYILISIPTSGLAIYDLTKVSESINVLGYTLAFITTFIMTFITGYLIMKKLEVKHLVYFGYYCLTVGIIAASYFLIF